MRALFLFPSAAITAFALLSMTPPASAEPASPAASTGASQGEEPPSRESRPAEWYGWQIMLADTGVAGTIALASVTPSPGGGLLGATALVGYSVDGPLIHEAHHQNRKIGASIVLRLVLPVVGMGIGLAVAASNPVKDPDAFFANWAWFWIGGAIGFGGGMLTASVVDSVVLGWGPTSRIDLDAARPRVRIAPSLSFVADARRDATPVLGVAGSL